MNKIFIMKRNNFLKRSILGLLLASSSILNAQDVTANFNWTNTSGNVNSSGQIQGCNGQIIDVNMTSSTLGHTLTGTTGAYFPEDANDPDTLVNISITFSTPVYDLSILMNDFDYNGTLSNSSSAREYASNISPYISSVTNLTPGNTSDDIFMVSGGARVEPLLNQDNTLGWLNWTGTITSVSFTYNRPSNGGWGLILERFSFNCEPTLSCICSKDKNIFNTIGRVSNNGQTSSEIQVNSNGLEISKLNISIPYWESLLDPSCLSCNSGAIFDAGKILTASTIVGVTPTFAGNGGPASEIVYEFSNPISLDDAITLFMQFPPALELSCCRNSVNYCIKIEMITENCEVCETTICTFNESEKESKVSDKKSTIANTNISTNVDSQNAITTISIYPNPASDIINIELPIAEGKLYIYNSNGQLINQIAVNSKNMRLNTLSMETGIYVIKHKYNGNSASEKLIVE